MIIFKISVQWQSIVNDQNLVEPSRISGALYHRVATYSVSAGFPASSWIWYSDRARPKSHSLTKQSVSSRMLDGWWKGQRGSNSERERREKERGWGILSKIQRKYLYSLILFKDKVTNNSTVELYQIIPPQYYRNKHECFSHLLVPMDDVAWVEVFGGFEELIENVALVNVFKQVPFPYNSMQVSICNGEGCMNTQRKHHSASVQIVSRHDIEPCSAMCGCRTN